MPISSSAVDAYMYCQYIKVFMSTVATAVGNTFID